MIQRSSAKRKRLFLTSLTFAAMVLGGCGSNVKPLEPVQSVDDFCRHGAARSPAILSIMSSISDVPPVALTRAEVPTLVQLKRTGGVIAHWHDLELLLPQSAKVLGSHDGYVHVTEAAIVDAAEDAQDRSVKLSVHRNGRDSWFQVSAFDVQSVCIEGGVKI